MRIGKRIHQVSLHFLLRNSFSKMGIKSHAIGDPFLDPITCSTSELFLQMTDKRPNKIHLNSYSQNISLTYQQLTNKAVQLAYSLIRDFKLQPNDRVGIYSFNKWQWYVVQLAAAMANLILVNINPSYRSEELAYTIEKVGLRVLFLSDKFRHSDYLEICRETVPELNSSQVNAHRIESKQFPHLDSIVRFNDCPNTKVNGFVNFTDLFHHEPSPSALPPPPSSHDPANIQFTSGTTGLPKAATLTHYNILNNGYVIGKRCNYTQDDNICIPVPMYHCFGMILGSLAAATRGAEQTFVCEGFDPKIALEAVSRYRCTAMYGVPTMFSEYLRVYEGSPEKYNLSSLRTGIIAGSLAPQFLMKKIFHTLNIPEITNCYGMTETSPVSFQTKVSDTFQHKTQTVGSVVEGVEARIVNDKGEVCEVGERGEFVAKGWVVMQGYWGDEQATKNSIVDGWMKSGDLGVFDENGYLTIVGRIKDMIIRGGENVYPKEIEEYISKRIDVLDVQVVAVSDDKFGEEIVALIKVNDLEQNTVTKEKILEICKDHIAHYKIPKFVKFVEELPLTVTGKPQKYIMREQLEDEKRVNGLKKYQIR